MREYFECGGVKGVEERSSILWQEWVSTTNPAVEKR